MREIIFKVTKEDGTTIGYERLNERGQWEMKYDNRSDIWILGVITYDSRGEILKRCQYTGLTNKNGNKIWEGDVNEDLGYVFWNKDFAAFQWRYPNGDVMEFEDEKEWCIIIGNIFDNPELLIND
jgi:hypothetical protein